MSSALYNCRNIIYTNCRRLNMRAFPKNATRVFTRFNEFKLNSGSLSQNLAIHRCLSTQPDTDSNIKPAYQPLMEFPPVIWPGFFQMIKCWLTFKLTIPALDQDFDLNEFIEGSQQAVYVISSALSRGDYESLEGLVTPEAIEVLKKNISKLSDDQKRELQLHKKEFFFCFPWEIGIRAGTEGSGKIVEVVMVYHLLRNWKDPEAPSKLIESDSGMQRLEIMQQMVSSEDYVSHSIVCNYRFVRDFGSADKSWFVNIVNQFKLSDVQN